MWSRKPLLCSVETHFALWQEASVPWHIGNVLTLSFPQFPQFFLVGILVCCHLSLKTEHLHININWSCQAIAKGDSLERAVDFVIVIYLPSLCFSVCRDENVIHVSDIAPHVSFLWPAVWLPCNCGAGIFWEVHSKSQEMPRTTKGVSSSKHHWSATTPVLIKFHWTPKNRGPRITLWNVNNLGTEITFQEFLFLP